MKIIDYGKQEMVLVTWSLDLSTYLKTIQTLYQKEEGIKTRENIQSFEFAPFKFNHVIQDNNFKQEFIPLEFLNHFKAVIFYFEFRCTEFEKRFLNGW